MQILNVSVNNRPARSVTSRPYSMEVTESVDFSTTMLNAALTNINFIEVASTSVGILDGFIRDLLVKYSLREVAASSVGIADVRLTYEVIYTKYNVGVEVGSSSVAIQDVALTREVKYISTKLDVEVAASSISIVDVKLI